MNSHLEKIIEAAKAGGAVLKKYYGESLETTQKTTVSDFRTKADLESEEAILNILTAAFPDYKILSEEKGEIYKDSEYAFVVDPLDGTNNFVLGIPNFSVSIGLLKHDEIIAGVIYVPIVENVYYAEKGQGAYFDGQKLQVNNEADITKASICHNCGYGTDFEQEVGIVRGLYAEDAKRVMSNWSPTFDFCMLAAGRVEGIINNNCELYDFAAGKLIVKEAGGLVTDFKGLPETSDKNQKFICSNGTKIHQHLVQIMTQIIT